MHVLVVGGTGAIGRPLVALLAESGHEVTATRRSAAQDPGVGTVALDLLDPTAVQDVVARTRPDAIVHVATAIPAQIDSKRIGTQFATTNALRTIGTRNLVEAARRHGVSRVVAQSVAFLYDPGDAVREESDPLWVDPPKPVAPVVDALRKLELLVGDVGGTVLRLGHLYGPGTAYARDGWMIATVRDRGLPIVGSGAARHSFVHVDDVATAFLAALDHPAGGTYNVVDDTPLRVREWLPWLAEQLGAKPPRRVPAAMARLAIGPFGVAFMDRFAGASNSRAREVLRWRPQHPTFRHGMAAELGGRPALQA